MTALRIVSVVGARPQFVKLAPLASAFDTMDDVEHLVVHSGQHYDDAMSEVFFRELGLPVPDVNLQAGSGSHAEQTATMIVGFEKYFAAESFDAVLVYGDTNTTLAATLAACKLNIRIAHVEAGLRSFNKRMPEEVNRIVTDHCSDRLYAPTQVAIDNLASENLANSAVLAGDVMLDAVDRFAAVAAVRSDVLQRLSLTGERFAALTIHRAENTTPARLPSVIAALRQLAQDQVPVIFPAHPRTAAVMETLALQMPSGITVLEPLAYLDNLALLDAAALVMTDSGGVQKEAAFLGTPCLTLRAETEWPETIASGANRLVADPADLGPAVREVLAGGAQSVDAIRQRTRREFGDGKAGRNIAADCVDWIRNAAESAH